MREKSGMEEVTTLNHRHDEHPRAGLDSETHGWIEKDGGRQIRAGRRVGRRGAEPATEGERDLEFVTARLPRGRRAAETEPVAGAPSVSAGHVVTVCAMARADRELTP